MSPSYYHSPHDVRIAYHYTPNQEESGNPPGVVFLGGFNSNMNGIKALFLEHVCARKGLAYLRFDYSGHGCSSGTFENGTIGSWMQDTIDIIGHIFGDRSVILVGSSMGGWIALRLLLNGSVSIKGLIGVAAAPDFTRDIQDRMTQQESEMLQRKGYFKMPSNYAQEPYKITRALLEDGKLQSVLNTVHRIKAPLTLIHGKQDTDVSWKKACDIASTIDGPNTRVILIEKGDHRLSEPENLHLVETELANITNLCTRENSCPSRHLDEGNNQGFNGLDCTEITVANKLHGTNKISEKRD